jgi:Sulfotransferase domain
MPERPRLPRPPRNRWTRRFLRRVPPQPPAGWQTGPPDFVGVGAQRSGSSWWFRVALDSHPSVVRVDTGLKELHFFDRFWDGRPPADFAERYHRYFPRPEGGVTGEWTPRYMYDHWSLGLLRQAAPAARILVILRDPVERYCSGLEAWRLRGLGTGRTLERISGAVSRSAYAGQLRRVFELFPREQVLVLQYERCTAQPSLEIERTWRFLGLAPESGSAPGPAEPAHAPRARSELPAGVREDLVARLRHDIDEVAELCPEIDLGLWPNFS